MEIRSNSSRKPVKEQPQSNSRAHLLGIGLDNQDGHKRITSADQFSIVGGSEETHDRMTETMVKTFEELDRNGKSLEKVEKRELAELLQKNTPR